MLSEKIYPKYTFICDHKIDPQQIPPCIRVKVWIMVRVFIAVFMFFLYFVFNVNIKNTKGYSVQLAYGYGITVISSWGTNMTKRKEKLNIIKKNVIKNFLTHDIFEIVIFQKTLHNHAVIVPCFNNFFCFIKDSSDPFNL